VSSAFLTTPERRISWGSIGEIVAKLTEPVPNPTLARLNKSKFGITAGETLTVVGFGDTLREDARVLQEVDVNALSDQDCRDSYDAGWYVDECMFCAFAPSKDACNGTFMSVKNKAGLLHGDDCAVLSFRSRCPSVALTYLRSIIVGRSVISCRVFSLIGDSGGPIVNSRGVQIGIVSWGRGCADKRVRCCFACNEILLVVRCSATPLANDMPFAFFLLFPSLFSVPTQYPGVYAKISSAVDWIDDMVCKWSDHAPSFWC